jgi:CopG family transcriptional regulator, nickel-responsive regulator
MQRFTITIDEDLLGMIDAVMERRGYLGCSGAVRDLIREAAARDISLADDTPCTVGYVDNHDTRALAQRLARAAHDNDDLNVASMHIHLNHETCLNVSVLRGPRSDVRELADGMTAQRGVRIRVCTSYRYR